MTNTILLKWIKIILFNCFIDILCLNLLYRSDEKLKMFLSGPNEHKPPHRLNAEIKHVLQISISHTELVRVS